MSAASIADALSKPIILRMIISVDGVDDGFNAVRSWWRRMAFRFKA